MSLNLHSSKLIIDLQLPPLCHFSITKAYLWGVIRHILTNKNYHFDTSPTVLDAACHQLITRSMFPSNYKYYGLDISLTRLRKGQSFLKDSDSLFLADITLPLNINMTMDVVVSCNTFSHLPDSQQLVALDNLISCCVYGCLLYTSDAADE